MSVLDKLAEDYVPSAEVRNRILEQGHNQSLKRGPGRPPILPPSTNASVRLPNDILASVDALIGKHGKTRADVIRVLVEAGLRALET